MIIHENEDRPNSPPKSQASEVHSSAVARAPSPPPSYTPTSPISPMGSPSSHPYAYQALPTHALLGRDLNEDRAAGHRASKRFFRSLGVALIIYIFLAFILGISIGGQMSFHKLPRLIPKSPASIPKSPTSTPKPPTPTPTPNEPTSNPDEHWQWPLPHKDDGEIIRCLSLDDWNREGESHATTSLDLSLEDKDYYIISRGRHATGSFLAEPSSDEELDSVRVNLAADYANPEGLENLKVCLLEKKHSGRRRLGVGIYTLSEFNEHLDVDLKINVLFPKKKTILTINSLALDLSSFYCQINTLKDILFGTLVVATSNAAIDSDGAIADDIVLASSNAYINGTYTAHQQITIATSNGPVHADVDLYSQDPRRASSITVTTSNAPVTLRSALFYKGDPQTAEVPHNGTFQVTTTTKNAGADVYFVDAPIGSALESVVTTSNADAHVYLHPTFEGTAQLISSGSPSKLEQSKPAPEDPSGEGRKRVVQITSIMPSFINAGIFWGEAKPKRETGSSLVTTSRGTSYLHI